MVGGLFHQVSIQLERDEKNTILQLNQSHITVVVKIINNLFLSGKAKSDHHIRVF